MELDEYLKLLEECEDAKLKDELGVYDNFPIFLNLNFEDVVEHLKDSGKYKPPKVYADRQQYWCIDGPVDLQVLKYIPSASTTGQGCNETELDKIESEKQLNEYTTTILLHINAQRKIRDVDMLRSLAIAVADIGKMIIKEAIPTCMSHSVGQRYREPYDYSRIVYHIPNMSTPTKK